MGVFLFPYKKVKEGSRVILYGMGAVGRIFVQQIQLNNYCELLFAVDKNYMSKDNELILVKAPNDILNENYDYIVIANKSYKIASEIKCYLLDLGVLENKIIYEHHELQTNGLVNMNELMSMLNGIESYCQNSFCLQIGKKFTESTLYKRYDQLAHCLDTKKIIGNAHFVRIGRNWDGGYIMVNQQWYGRNVYSFGIADDVSFELELAKNGANIFMYDHTIYKLPREHKNFKWYRKGIQENSVGNINFVTLEETIRLNGHEKDNELILKMDVEGAEWEFLNIVPLATIKKFSQIVFELHNINDKKTLDLHISALERLNETHQLVFIHPNNYSGIFYIGKHMFSSEVEVLYVRRSD